MKIIDLNRCELSIKNIYYIRKIQKVGIIGMKPITNISKYRPTIYTEIHAK